MKKFWNHRRVLVAGGAGFIGSHTVDALVAQGARVAVVDDLSSGRRENVHPNVRFYRMPTASRALGNVFRREKPEYVFAFAAVSNPPVSIVEPLRDVAGLAGLLNLLEFSRAHTAKRVLYASSGYIYGNAGRFPTPETEPFQPLAPYNISKFAGEQYLKFYREHHGLDSVILRYSTVYGPRQVSRVIEDYILKISNGRRAAIYGAKTRDYVHVTDIVRANLAAMEIRGYRGDPVFNIGSGKETDMADLYAALAAILGRPNNRPIRKPPKPAEVDRFWVDIRRARRILGYRPTVKLTDGLSETVAWFKATHRI
ncbi:NAD-dependent epimerase/dehydratase family protein [Candidatus Parcubacteria bacterium]|nr:MAG: NAD-dependent epimerase/dehydratase family protein [Candidatus Parcubacteria bacterium]